MQRSGHEIVFGNNLEIQKNILLLPPQLVL
jgi:hypothetical protein